MEQVTGPLSPIAAALYRIFQEYRVYIFLIDGSSSVPHTGFQTMISTVRTIVNRINMQACCAGVFQYSTKVTPSCLPTSNLQQIHQALDNMVQERAGNDEVLALQAVVTAAKECPTNGKRIIIHLTDGGLLGGWKQAATNVKYGEKIEIMSIGVGEKIDAQNIREFASPDLAFFVKDYSELQAMFKFLDLTPLPIPILKPVPEKKVDARTIHLEVDTYSLASDVKAYHVQALHPAAAEWKFVASSISPKIVLKEGIQPNKTYTLRVYVELRNGRTSAPSNEVTVTTLRANPHEAASKNLPAAVAARLKALQEFGFCKASQRMGLKRYRAQLNGVPGAGKSAILTAFNSMLKGRYQPVGVTGEVNVTLTRVITELDELQTLTVLDTFGMTEDNLKIYGKYLYYGGVPVSLDERNPDMTKLRNVDQVPIQEQVHCVVFAVSCEALVDPQFMALLKQQYELILTQGRNCLILLTKVDKVDPRIRLTEPETLPLVWESGVVMTFRKSLAAHLGLSVDCILPLVSYNAPMKPIPWVSMLHLDWIEKALELSDGFCSTFLSVELSKRRQTNYKSTDDLMAELLAENLTVGSRGTVPKVIPPTNYSAVPGNVTPTPEPSKVSPSGTVPAPLADSSVFEILIRREEDPTDDWASIYLSNSDRSMQALKNAICAKYPPRVAASIVKIVESRKIGGNSFNKRVDSDPDVSHLINSAAQGNMVFVVVSFTVIDK